MTILSTLESIILVKSSNALQDACLCNHKERKIYRVRVSPCSLCYLHRKLQVSNLTHLSQSESPHGQIDSRIC